MEQEEKGRPAPSPHKKSPPPASGVDAVIDLLLPASVGSVALLEKRIDNGLESVNEAMGRISADLTYLRRTSHELVNAVANIRAQAKQDLDDLRTQVLALATQLERTVDAVRRLADGKKPFPIPDIDGGEST